MTTGPRILAVIPCYNESASIGKVLDDLNAHLPDVDTVVVDDGSTDNSYQIASARTTTLRLSNNLGIGGAVQTGILYADRHGYDYCFQFDGDGQHRASEVARLVAVAEKADASDIVIGSRYLTKGGDFRSTFARRLGSRIICWTLRSCFGVRITDPTSGMRLLNKKAIALFAKDYPPDFPEPISLANALKHGLTATETTVQMSAREHGVSSIVGFKPVSYMVRVTAYIVLSGLTKFRKT
ncbi:MAG: glycosyltransferase [Bdellovibrionaceae bacterium]|nr:glycosyltransferase [Pseudobdellovibrionaceae bacterium]